MMKLCATSVSFSLRCLSSSIWRMIWTKTQPKKRHKRGLTKKKIVIFTCFFGSLFGTKNHKHTVLKWRPTGAIMWRQGNQLRVTYCSLIILLLVYNSNSVITDSRSLLLRLINWYFPFLLQWSVMLWYSRRRSLWCLSPRLWRRWKDVPPETKSLSWQPMCIRYSERY